MEGCCLQHEGMKVELHRNGSYQLHFIELDATEYLWLCEMESRAQKGQTIKLEVKRPSDAEPWWILSVEEKR
jgi:hypothetical protein